VDPQGVERKLAAILSADVVGYSRLMAEDEAGTVRTLTAYRQQVATLVQEHRGRVVDAPGDNLLAEFPTATDAVECAAEIQRVLRARNAPLPADRRMEFRIGVHLGEVRVEDERIYGDGVNIAARLEALAEPGGICVSAEVQRQVHQKLQLEYEDLGEQSVKNVPGPVHVFRVKLETEALPPEAPPRPVRRALMVAGLLVLLGAAALMGWRMFGDRATELPAAALTTPIRSIAVLPLENLSGDPEQEYFADGMTEALIGDLAKISALRVISRTSVMRYKGSDKSLPEIARELNVEGIVEGTVMRAGDRVRITGQLIDARDDRHLWSGRYDGELSDVLALQSDVARSIADQVEIELTPDEESRLARDRTVDPAAHDLVLRAAYWVSQYAEESLERGIRLYQEALRRDPGSVHAYSGLAQAYTVLAMASGAPPREIMPLAKAAAAKALELDDGNPFAHVSTGMVLAFWHWDFDGTERELRRAIELDQSSAGAHFTLSWFLSAVRRHEEALVEIEKAVSLNPWDLLTLTHVGYPYYMARQYDRAIVEFDKALAIDPAFFDTHFHLGWAYIHKGMYAEAIAALEKAALLEGRVPRARAGLAYAYARGGRTAEAVAIVEEMKQKSTSHYVSPYCIALAYTGLGRTAEAFESLEAAYQARDVWIIELLVEPGFDPLRSDPRFDDLVRRIGFPGS
jgi:TolB-like protein/class 3 adenylate cyclase/Tfp pilus assembly protein PilF